MVEISAAIGARHPMSLRCGSGDTSQCPWAFDRYEYQGIVIKMSRTYRTATRLLRILDHFGSARLALSVRDVHQALQTDEPADERTYRRDLETLESLGFLTAQPPEGDAPPITRYKAHRTLKVGRAVTLDLRELLALYVAKSWLEPLRETPLFPDLERVFSRIETALGPKCREYLSDVSQEMRFDPGPRWGLGIGADVIETLERACAEGHVVTLEYDSANSGKKMARRLGPHFLYFSKGSLYLVAEDTEVAMVKTFALPRMGNVVMTDEAYTGERVDPETHFSGALGVFRGKAEKVELLFHGPQAAFAKERRWHPSQKSVAKPSGKLAVSLEVALTPELVAWVLGFGSGVRVVSPPKLIEMMLHEGRGILAHYEVPGKAA